MEKEEEWKRRRVKGRRVEIKKKNIRMEEKKNKRRWGKAEGRIMNIHFQETLNDGYCMVSHFQEASSACAMHGFKQTDDRVVGNRFLPYKKFKELYIFFLNLFKLTFI